MSVEGDEMLARRGRVDFGGIVKDVSLACVPEAVVGDYVIVHVGMAISRVDEEEAQQVLGYLRQIGELAELEEHR
jgi:hydrogenase expression/formation protein HypC